MNKALPKVSVIVTTYNQEDTLAATLESILAQDCVFTFEIELADDCSTDSTGDICREYASRYPHIIRYTRNKVNRGARDNYFDTLLRCRAPYIADVAGDDLWCDTSKLRRQADILGRNPDITLVHTGWQYLDAATGATRPSDADTTAPWMQPVADGRMLLEPLLAANGSMTVHSCTCLFRKQTFIDAYKADEPLFRSGEYPCEDLQLIAVLAAAGKVAYIPDITLNYRVGHSSQLTSAADAARAFRFYFGTLRLRLRYSRHSPSGIHPRQTASPPSAPPPLCSSRAPAPVTTCRSHPYHHKKRRRGLSLGAGRVDLPGLEPGQAEPKTAVLPLHHKSILSDPKGRTPL